MTHPTVDDAKRLARKYGKDGVIVFFVDAAAEVFGYASYGTDKPTCNQMRQLADRMYEAVSG